MLSQDENPSADRELSSLSTLLLLCDGTGQSRPPRLSGSKHSPGSTPQELVHPHPGSGADGDQSPHQAICVRGAPPDCRMLPGDWAQQSVPREHLL